MMKTSKRHYLLLSLAIASISSSRAQRVCEDNQDFTFEVNGEDEGVGCGWITQSSDPATTERRISNKCTGIIEDNCPFSCDTCCVDDTTFTFEVNGEANPVGCGWITQSADAATTERRIANKCAIDSIDLACRLTCGYCSSPKDEGPDTSVGADKSVTVTLSPTSSPTGSSTSSPTSSPTTSPTSSPTTSPTAALPTTSTTLNPVASPKTKMPKKSTKAPKNKKKSTKSPKSKKCKKPKGAMTTSVYTAMTVPSDDIFTVEEVNEYFDALFCPGTQVSDRKLQDVTTPSDSSVVGYKAIEVILGESCEEETTCLILLEGQAYNFGTIDMDDIKATLEMFITDIGADYDLNIFIPKRDQSHAKKKKSTKSPKSPKMSKSPKGTKSPKMSKSPKGTKSPKATKSPKGTKAPKTKKCKAPKGSKKVPGIVEIYAPPEDATKEAIEDLFAKRFCPEDDAAIRKLNAKNYRSLDEVAVEVGENFGIVGSEVNDVVENYCDDGEGCYFDVEGVIYYDPAAVGDDLDVSIDLFFEDFFPEGISYEGFTFILEDNALSGVSAANFETTVMTGGSKAGVAIGCVLAVSAFVGLAFLMQKRRVRNRRSNDFTQGDMSSERALISGAPNDLVAGEGQPIAFPVRDNSLEAGFEIAR